MDEPIKLLSLFSGIGAFERALENIGVPYELVGYSEIDKSASKAYSILHGVPETMNLGDVSAIDAANLPPVDAVVYGFPCQDISIAGTKRGFRDENGAKTRSGLFYDALRIIETTKPRFAIAENVKHLTSASMKPVFDAVLSGLEHAGYNNYWAVLNAADYEIPQDRRRVLIVSIRKDVDNRGFRFPDHVPLKTRMGDFLDDAVPESYYLSDDKLRNVIAHNEAHAGQLCERGGALYNTPREGLQRS